LTLIGVARERVSQGLLDVRFINPMDQIADGFTKPVSLPKLIQNNLNLEAS
jgi:hypothetical protein